MSGADLDKRSIEILGQVVIALKSFQGKYDKKFNFSKLSRYFQLSESDVHYLATFLINFQDEFKEFTNIFKEHELSIKHENGNLYITAKRKKDEIPELIKVKKEHSGWLSDLIYTFQHVKKGKGFNLTNKNMEIMKKINILLREHPYFFEKNGSNMIYPSRLGSELGNAILSCKKLNKELETIKIQEHEIRVEKSCQE